MTLAKRTAVLQAFRQGGPGDARVLIISSAGATGLNIAFANILQHLPFIFEEVDGLDRYPTTLNSDTLNNRCASRLQA